MNSIIKVGKLHMDKVTDFILLNISKTLPMLQGIDFANSAILEGYSYYIYGRALNSGIFVEGIICISPSDAMSFYFKDNSIFEKLDFFKFIKLKSPDVVKAEESTAKEFKKFLEKVKISYDAGDMDLMKININPNQSVEKRSNDEFQIMDYSDADSIDDTIRLINNAQKEFGKNIFSRSDIIKVVIPRLQSKEYIIAKKYGVPSVQGCIEFEKRGIALIGSIYTVPESRKEGGANMLIAALIDECRKRNAIPFLFVENKNANAIGLYEKIGFVEVAKWKQFKLYNSVY